MFFIAIEQLLQKLFFLGHKESVGERTTPPSSSGFSIVVFEFPSPLCKEAACVFTFLEYIKHLPRMTCQAAKIKCPTERLRGI